MNTMRIARNANLTKSPRRVRGFFVWQKLKFFMAELSEGAGKDKLVFDLLMSGYWCIIELLVRGTYREGKNK